MIGDDGNNPFEIPDKEDRPIREGEHIIIDKSGFVIVYTIKHHVGRY